MSKENRYRFFFPDGQTPEPGPYLKEFTRLGKRKARKLLEAEGKASLEKKARVYEKTMETGKIEPRRIGCLARIIFS